MANGMIYQAFGGMITLMVAKFMLNDVPHAIGIIDKPLTRYYLACKQCGYRYMVSFSNGPYELEACPVCGYSAPFGEFVQAGGYAWST